MPMMILQAFLEAATLGGFFIALFGGIHFMPRRIKRTVHRVFTRLGL